MNAVPGIGEGLYVGLMSGTSADGIDAALCRFAPHPQLLEALVHPWPADLHHQLLAVAQAQTNAGPDALGRLDTTLGEQFAVATRALLAKAGVKPKQVRAIGSHGQTVRHRASGQHPFTMQLGNPWVIAERCQIDTVADFRRADIAAGGQGAPLMPVFHAAAFARAGETLGVLNLGGIANLTILAADGSVRGFDTGPANALMDAWMQRHLGRPMDMDGTFAARGTCDTALLQRLLADPYFALAPPKSTGREYFHLDWLEAHLKAGTCGAPEDIQATLLALTVRSIVAAVAAHAADCEEILVCGGGVHNAALLHALGEALAPRRIRSTASAGVDPDYLEAMGFAWLARQRLLNKPGNIPAVTGARGYRLLGAIYPASRS